MARKDFSVIIPTYTGADTISGCLESILKQGNLNNHPQVVVVIDGPNHQLATICKKYESIFLAKGVDFRVEQFNKNKGRFEARLHGARLARANTLLFLDDRITFDSTYFETIISLKKGVTIPNVMEAISKNFISRCLYLLRRLVYGKKKFGTSFESYYITQENFENSPKGTTSLLVDKKLFIDACENIKKHARNSKYTNEDTKLFKEFLRVGQSIYKSSEAVINYQPRSGGLEEIVHIYHRGPRFVDYYIRPGTRFFWPLVGISMSPFLLGLLVLLVPSALLFMLIGAFVGLVAVVLFISEKPTDVAVIFFGVPLVFISFYSGVITGIIKYSASVIYQK